MPLPTIFFPVGVHQAPRIHHHTPSPIGGPNHAEAAQNTTPRANTNATIPQRGIYLANQLWQRTLGAVAIAGSAAGTQMLALKFTSNLPAMGFVGGMTSSLMKAYPLKALENIGPNLKLPSASEGNLYSKQEFFVKLADGLLDGALYMTASVILSQAKNLVGTHNMGPGAKFDDAAYAKLLRSHPEIMLALTATSAGADFVHYMLTAAITAAMPSAKYQLKSFSNQLKDASQHLAFWNNSDQALKSNTEIGVRAIVAAGTSSWLPLSAALFPSASKSANFAQSGPTKSAAGSILRVGQGIAKDWAFNKAKAYRDRPSQQNTSPAEVDLEAGRANVGGSTPQNLLDASARRNASSPESSPASSSRSSLNSDVAALVTQVQAEQYAQELELSEQPSSSRESSPASSSRSSLNSDTAALVTQVQAEQYAQELGLEAPQPSASTDTEEFYDASDEEFSKRKN